MEEIHSTANCGRIFSCDESWCENLLNVGQLLLSLFPCKHQPLTSSRLPVCFQQFQLWGHLCSHSSSFWPCSPLKWVLTCWWEMEVPEVKQGNGGAEAKVSAMGLTGGWVTNFSIQRGPKPMVLQGAMETSQGSCRILTKTFATLYDVQDYSPDGEWQPMAQWVNILRCTGLWGFGKEVWG